MIYFRKFSEHYGTRLTVDQLIDPKIKKDAKGIPRIHGLEIAFEYSESLAERKGPKFKPTYTVIPKGKFTEIYITCPLPSCRRILSLNETTVYPSLKGIWTISPCVWCDCETHTFPHMIDLDKHVPEEFDLLG